jgi:hypothetical protein
MKNVKNDIRKITINARGMSVTNGEKKIYDVSRLWDKEMFAPLKNPSFFKNVKIEKGGYAVYWNDNIDISEYELWKNGRNSQ